MDSKEPLLIVLQDHIKFQYISLSYASNIAPPQPQSFPLGEPNVGKRILSDRLFICIVVERDMFARSGCTDTHFNHEYHR